MLYSTRHLSEMFSLSPSAVKKYADLYSKFLSTEASPDGKGRHRYFSVDDLKVFSLINDYRKRGVSHDDIYLALSNNERGELPSQYGEFSLTVDSREQVLLLQSRVENLTAQLETLKASELRAIKAEAIADELRAQLATAQATIVALNRELGSR